MFKIGFWNVRGIKKKDLSEFVNFMCKFYFILFMVFYEIKLNE